MTSKSLFFKLIKENAKQRLWSIALIALVFFFAFPVSTALNISSRLDPDQLSGMADPTAALLQARADLTDHFLQYCSAASGTVVTLMVLFAVICGVSGYSYLHSRKKTDFYHSIPVRREVLFAAVCLSGILYVAIPYFVWMSVAAVMVQVKGVGFSLVPMLAGFAQHMAFYILVYATVIAAVILTGNTIVGLLGTAVFFSWGPGVVALALSYFSQYFSTFYEDGSGWVWASRTSPFAWYVSAAASRHPAAAAGWALLFGILILGLALFLYRKRPSEAAGRAMAFPVSQPIIKFLLVVPLSLLGSILFSSLMGSDGWAVFGLLCGLIISGCIIEIIYQSDFKRLFAHKRQLVLCGAAAAVILAVFRFDLIGYDSYLPSPERLEAAGIYTYRLDMEAMDNFGAEPILVETNSKDHHYISWKRPSEDDIAGGMRLTEPEDVLAIARRGIEDRTGWERGRHSFYTHREGDDVYGTVLVAYRLKNGKNVYRSYYMNLSAVAENLDRIYDTEAYKEAVYPVLSYDPQEIAGVNYQEHQEFSHVEFADPARMGELLLTYQKELKNLTAATRRTESPVAALQFKTREMQEMIDTLREERNNYETFNYYRYFPVYPSFTETIAILEDCGIRVGGILTPENTERIVLEYQGSREAITDGPEAEETGALRRPRIVITDREQIGEILKACVSADLGQDNLLNARYTGISVTAYVPVGESEELELSEDIGQDDAESAAGEPESSADIWQDDAQSAAAAASADIWQGYAQKAAFEDSDEFYNSYNLAFDYDRIPEFVKETFSLNEARMEADRAVAY